MSAPPSAAEVPEPSAAEVPESSPALRGRRVVVCRPVDQAGALVTAIERLGGVAIAFPLLELSEPHDGGAALEHALARAEAFDWLVLTSANAVRAVADRRPTLPASLRIAAVGPATARAAAVAGWSIDFQPSAATAETLALDLPLDLPARVLAPLAELAAATLVETLTARGATVERVEAYRMRVPRHSSEQLDAALGADAVLLTSPSIAERFAALARTRGVGSGSSALPPAIVIGPSTEAAAIERGFTVVGAADPHTEDGLLAALVRSIGT